MLSEIAIMALAILNQFSLIHADKNKDVFLGQFIGFNNYQEIALVKENGAEFYGKNMSKENKLSVLPRKIKEDRLEVDAASAFAMDAGTDYPLFEKNSKKEMKIASITKIMTALVVLEKSDLDDTVTISPKAMQMFGEKKGLVEEEKIKLKDLLEIMIIDSNNCAAYALAEHAGGNADEFVKLMNEKAEKLGLKNTKFFNPTGLDASAGSDNYSTAYDLAQLTDYALSKDLIWEFSRTQEATVYSIDKKQTHHVKNTDELLGKMSNVFGGKTGYTVNAGECLALISESPGDRHKVISVVLNAQDRFAETKKIVDWIFQNYRW